MFPVTFEPETVTIFASVTLASSIFEVVIALFAITGEAAVPVKSPANCILPLVVASASAIVADKT